MLRRSALAMLAVAAASPAFGQAYPNKPINLIVPFAAGGPTDLMARIVGERMSKDLGQQLIIDNVTGAAGSIAMGKLARSAPDGYTIGIGHLGTNVVNGAIYKNLNYDLQNDLLPIALLPSNPLLVVTSNQVPAKDLKELVAYLNANAEQDLRRHGGHGLGLPYRRAGLLRRHRHQLPARALPRHRPGRAGPDRQSDPDHDRPVLELPAACPRGQAQGLCRDRQAAHGGRTRYPDHGRSGLPRHRGRDLARPLGAQGHAARHHRQAERRSGRRPARTRRSGASSRISARTSRRLRKCSPTLSAAFQKAEFAKWKPIIDKAGVKVE